MIQDVHTLNSMKDVELFKQSDQSDKSGGEIVHDTQFVNSKEDAEEKFHFPTPRSCKKRKPQKPVYRSKSCNRERMENVFLDSYSILQAVAARAIPCVQPSCYNSGRLSPTGSMA